MNTRTAKPLTEARYIWEPKPINIWVSMQPHNLLQSHVLQQLRTRFEKIGCVFLENKRQASPLGTELHLGICFGQDIDEEVDTLKRLGALPKPRGLMLCIMSVDRIPEDIPRFDLGRGQIVKKASQILIMVEGAADGRECKRALWASMPGNNVILSGEQDDLFDKLAIRVLAHAGADKVNQATKDRKSSLTWADWSASALHTDLADAAHKLGEAGLIEEEIPLERYATEGQVKNTLRFLNRAAMGEGMRSQLDLKLRVMGITASGGNKISISADPAEGHILPMKQLTWKGYVQTLPLGCPISYSTPSVETHENGMVYLAGALINAGLIDSFADFLAYLDRHFSEHERLDILPDGMTPRVSAIDHFHRQPVVSSIKEPDRVQIVYPDPHAFPEIDYPCGVREAEYHLLSALFCSEWFTGSEALGDRLIIAVIPGHGLMAVYDGPRREMTELLVNGMEMTEIIRV